LLFGGRIALYPFDTKGQAMLPRRFFFGMLLLVSLFTAGIAATRQWGHHLTGYYNCLYIGDVRVQLNTHLEHVQAHAVSPDGRYLLGSVQLADSSVVFIEDIETGKRSSIQRIPPIDHETARWLPDGERVYYGWFDRKGEFHASLASRQGHLIVNIDTGMYHTLYSFSSDGKYGAILNNPGSGAVLILDDRPQIIGYIGGIYAWAPVGNHVAYLDSDMRLAVANFDDGTLLQSSIAVSRLPKTDLTRYFYTSNSWSVDARYLAVVDRAGPVLIHIFSAEGGTLAHMVDIESEFDTGELTGGYWPQDVHEFVYFLETPSRGYDLWNFDTETQQSQQVASGISNYVYSYRSSQLVTFREEGDFVVLEYRNSDGTNPRDIRRFRQESGDVPQVKCTWNDSTFLSAPVLQCDAPFDDPGLFLLNESGETLWPTDLPPGTQVQGYSHGNTRIEQILLRQGERNWWFEIVDLETQQAHRQPTWVTDRLPPMWGFIVLPWPNDAESWLVYFDDNIQYRFWPAENTWEIIQHPHPIGTWSPDGKRIAFVRDSSVSGMVDLFVQEADNSKQWNLGAFPQSMGTKVYWTQCGDIFAPIRDARAAEEP
jgi:hypothetical protein